MVYQILSNPDLCTWGRRNEWLTFLSEYFSETRSSGLVWVIAGFGALIGLNLITLVLDPGNVLQALNSHPWGVILSIFVFDSWGTIAGFAGVVMLFTPVLFGEPAPRRRKLSVFFVVASVGIGLAVTILWNQVYNYGGFIGAGPSSIAIAAQGIIFTLSLFGLLRLFGRRATIDSAESDYSWFYGGAYLVLILSTLFFILVLQPVFVPSDLFNWRVHEFGFALAVVVTGAYGAMDLRTKGL